MPWETLISQPITQGAAILGLVFLLNKWGIIDLQAGLRRSLGMHEKQEGEHDVPSTLDLLLGQMNTLSNHFNHETTLQNAQIAEELRNLGRVLGEIKEYGVKCRKE